MSSEKKLLQFISQSDASAFEVLFNTYKNLVYNIAHTFTHCDASSEEIVQETFLIIWQRRGKLTDIENFKAYLITIAKHLVYKSLNEKAKKHIADIANENITKTSLDAETILLEKEYKHILQKAIQRLPQQQKKVYLLVKENGLKRDEVANMLNVAPDTVKFHLAQAMKSIRAYCSMHLGVSFFLIIETIF